MAMRSVAAHSSSTPTHQPSSSGCGSTHERADLGVGRRLLAELEQRALASGSRTVRLETNEALTEAIAMYRAAGYREVDAFNDEPYAHHWFEKRID